MSYKRLALFVCLWVFSQHALAQTTPAFYPGAGAKIDPLTDQVHRFEFHWSAVNKARIYYFELQDHLGKKLYSEKTILQSLPMALPSGAYRWAICPLQIDGEENSCNKNFSEFEILNPLDSKKENYYLGIQNKPLESDDKSLGTVNTAGRNYFVKVVPLHNRETQTTSFYNGDTVEVAPITPFSWMNGNEENIKSAQYEGELTKLGLKDNQKYKASEPLILYSAQPVFNVRLSPGTYQIRGREKKTGEPSPWSELKEFFVPFNGAEIIYPANNEKVKPLNGFKIDVTIQWVAPEGAVKYLVYILDRDGFVIEKHETTEPQLTVNLKTKLSYGVYVQPFGPDEPETLYQRGSVEYSTFQIERFLGSNVELAEAEEPAHLYGWGSYLNSQVSYLSKNTDNNSLTTNKISAQSGEFAVGYWHPKNWGLLGFAELSGINTPPHLNMYYATGIVGGKRWKLKDRSRLRLWAGVGSKALPEWITEPGTSAISVRNITSGGTYLRGSLVGPLTKDLNWYLFANYYQSFLTVATPNNQPIKEMTNTQLGMYVSRRLNDDYKLRGGYTQRWDDATYQGLNGAGGNKVQINGGYLSLILEFALQSTDDADE